MRFVEAVQPFGRRGVEFLGFVAAVFFMGFERLEVRGKGEALPIEVQRAAV